MFFERLSPSCNCFLNWSTNWDRFFVTCQRRSRLQLGGQSSGHSVAVCFHFSGVRPPGCDDAMHCRYGTETKTLGKHLNSSAGYLATCFSWKDRLRALSAIPEEKNPTWRPVTLHVWEFAFQLYTQAGHDTMFCWLCMLWQDFSPFNLVRNSCLLSDELGEWRILAGHLPCSMWPP